MNATQKLLSASELSRLSNVPLSRLLRAVKTGTIRADATAMDERLFLFVESRTTEIKAQLANL